jgi:AcrR family transcriptional regulator
VGRPPGSRSVDYDEKRDALALAMARAVLEGREVSLAQLAESAGVSVPTLKHYFGDREGALEAALAAAASLGAPHLDHLRRTDDQSIHASLLGMLRYVVQGWSVGVGELHAEALRHGLREPTLGPAYLGHVLEPMILAVEERLVRHAERGELAFDDARVAALALLAPLVLGLLHQRQLGGHRTRPLDEDEFLQRLVEGFLAGYAAPSDTRKPRR